MIFTHTCSPVASSTARRDWPHDPSAMCDLMWYHRAVPVSDRSCSRTWSASYSGGAVPVPGLVMRFGTSICSGKWLADGGRASDRTWKSTSCTTMEDGAEIDRGASGEPALARRLLRTDGGVELGGGGGRGGSMVAAERECSGGAARAALLPGRGRRSNAANTAEGAYRLPPGHARGLLRR